MENQKDRKEQRIRQLSVAAFLRMKGHAVIRFEPVPGKQFSDIVFEKSSTIVADQARFFEGATVNALEYYQELTELKKNIQEHRRHELQTREIDRQRS